jgi:hypothetical protein
VVVVLLVLLLEQAVVEVQLTAILALVVEEAE